MLTIGEFSRLSHVSSRMLRHYDLLGLLRPVKVGPENGYRYYDRAQLTTLVQIEQLKSFGFPLSDIGQLLALPQGELARRIHARRLEAHGELVALRTTLAQMERDIIRMEGTAMSLNKYHVILMDCPAQTVFTLRKTINIAQTHALFQQLLEDMQAQGLRRTGPTQQMFMGEEFSYESLDLMAQVQVAEDSAGPGVRVLPAGTFVATTHTGPYEDLRYAYDAISDWMAAHPEYRVCGPGIERYIKDEGTCTSPEAYETGVLFPVEGASAQADG